MRLVERRNEDISKQAFTPSHPKANVPSSAFNFWRVGGTFDETELEKAIKNIIAKNLEHGEANPDLALLQENEEHLHAAVNTGKV